MKPKTSKLPPRIDAATRTQVTGTPASGFSRHEGERRYVRAAHGRSIVLAALILAGLWVGRAYAAAPTATLENDAYRMVVQSDGSLAVRPKDGLIDTVFRPEFIAVVQPAPLVPVGGKSEEPIYNLTGWRVAGGPTILDVFKVGTVVPLAASAVTVSASSVRWSFAAKELDLTAEVVLPPGRADPRITYTFKAKTAAHYSVAYSGAPAATLSDVVELWQPLVWDGRRLPPAGLLMPDDHCSIPGCLVQTKTGTLGVMADPWQFPYAMPNGRNRRFGVTVCNSEGRAQPLVFTPFPGAGDSRYEPGRGSTYSVMLVARPEPLTATFEHVARAICDFGDRRENTLCSLNQTLDNILEYVLGPHGHFEPAQRAFSYPDSGGTVKNVSALHPLTLGIVTDNEELFRTQGMPILEYLMSREKFLFALTEEAQRRATQSPSRKLAGPAMPLSELAVLHRITGGSSPVFAAYARELHGRDRKLNMEWVTAGDSWQNDLWLYRVTGEQHYLTAAQRKADTYIAERVERRPVDFSEAGVGTFFDYMIPWWKDLYELYVETKSARYLQAAHAGARRYAQFVWFYPAIPDRDITVNQSGFAPRRGSDLPGLIPVKPETVPAWRVSEQGLIAEGNGTSQRIGILLASHAPYFLRLAGQTGDGFLRDIGRSAVIGRYASFPGYHINTHYSTAQEKFDFPLHAHADLARTTSFHFNHILPMANLVLDYLMAEAYDRSRGAVDFPGDYAESYAYLGGLVYGRPGRFYDVDQVQPWMPKGLLTTNSVQVNHVAGRTNDDFCVALMNESNRPLPDVNVQLDRARFAGNATGVLSGVAWVDGRRQDKPVRVEHGGFSVSLPAKGMVAIRIPGLTAVPAFQHKIRPEAAPQGVARHVRIPTATGEEMEAMVISFGPEVTWLYAFLRGEEGAAKSVTLGVTTGGSTRTLLDTTFPFEFSTPLSPSDVEILLNAEVEDQTGRKLRTQPVAMPLETRL